MILGVSGVRRGSTGGQRWQEIYVRLVEPIDNSEDAVYQVAVLAEEALLTFFDKQEIPVKIVERILDKLE